MRDGMMKTLQEIQLDSVTGSSDTCSVADRQTRLDYLTFKAKDLITQ